MPLTGATRRKIHRDSKALAKRTRGRATGMAQCENELDVVIDQQRADMVSGGSRHRSASSLPGWDHVWSTGSGEETGRVLSRARLLTQAPKAEVLALLRSVPDFSAEQESARAGGFRRLKVSPICI